MQDVDLFIDTFEGSGRGVLVFLHELLVEEYQLIPRIRYRIPFYDRNSWICYLSPLKDGTIEWAFTRGNELANERGILESRGRKQVMSLIVSRIEDIPLDAARELLAEALVLDETVPYTVRKKRS